MGSAVQQVRAYVAAMLRTTRLMLGPIAAYLREAAGKPNADERWILERLLATLHAHDEELAEHLMRLGGQSEPQPQTAEPSVQPARDLRQTHGALLLVHNEALMLETNARALEFSSTAALARRHREELSTILARMRELLPASVKGEIEKEPTAY